MDIEEKLETADLVYDLGTGIFYCYHPSEIVNFDLNKFSIFFRSNYDFYESAADGYKSRIMREFTSGLYSWGKKYPYDANFILAVVSQDIYNILTDDDIKRLKRKVDSLNPIDEEFYNRLISITTSLECNQKKNILEMKIL